jgi:hypothetical protein
MSVKGLFKALLTQDSQSHAWILIGYLLKVPSCHNHNEVF